MQEKGYLQPKNWQTTKTILIQVIALRLDQSQDLPGKLLRLFPPKPSPTEAMGTEESNYQARTSETFDTSMISCDAEEGEVIEEEEDDTMDDIYEDEDDEEVETVTEVKRRKATAPLAGV